MCMAHAETALTNPLQGLKNALNPVQDFKNHFTTADDRRAEVASEQASQQRRAQHTNYMQDHATKLQQMQQKTPLQARPVASGLGQVFSQMSDQAAGDAVRTVR